MKNKHAQTFNLGCYVQHLFLEKHRRGGIKYFIDVFQRHLPDFAEHRRAQVLSPHHLSSSSLFCQFQEWFEQIDRAGEDICGVVLCRDLVNGLVIAKLQSAFHLHFHLAIHT